MTKTSRYKGLVLGSFLAPDIDMIFGDGLLLLFFVIWFVWSLRGSIRIFDREKYFNPMPIFRFWFVLSCH